MIRRSTSAVFPLLALSSLQTFAIPPANDFTPQAQVPYHTPQEFLKTVQLPEGYSLELVLSEPQIKEPVTLAFDPDGAMYVAEMRTYMQDINGKDELTPHSVVSKHFSSKGDGVFDKHSTYLENLLLPRMILPLDDRILLGITNTDDLSIHRDANHDGVADESKPWYAGGNRGGNMEHQPSGLIWGLDNWLYSTYKSYRLRWNGENEAPRREDTPGNGGQWGLGQDNYGKMWWSNAGGEMGLGNFQTPIIYGANNAPSQKEQGFDTTWPLVGARDFQGGPGKSRENGTLNHFTGCAGQTVFRGDRLPKELLGNVFLPEPVGRLIRRSVVDESDAVTRISNPHPQSEFLRSSDLCFRPLNMTTGPDGCLYIVDMYRGIIQEGAWVNQGSYLRKVVEQYGFQNNIGRGRVWRLVHKDFKPGPQPKMLSETPAQWMAHLAHPNGWWRDTAQRLLIVKGDKSVVPALTKMCKTHTDHLARIHALWTLEGLGSLTPELLHGVMQDSDALVRVQAIRAGESLIKAGDSSLIAAVEKAATDKDVRVQFQGMLTSKLLNLPGWQENTAATLATSTSQGLVEVAQAALKTGGAAPVPQMSKEQRHQYTSGMKIYQEVCFACHGRDGKGTPIAGTNKTLAPPLGGSKTVAQGDAMLRVLLNGLEGPINGKTYESQMIPQNSNSDQWLADITSYVRNSFGNKGPFVQAGKVGNLRKELSSRTKAWNIDELRALLPLMLDNRKAWKLSSSQNAGALAGCVDNNPSSRWDTGASQLPGMWVQIELPGETALSGIELDCNGSASDFPRKYEIQTSQDGKTWSTPVSKGDGSPGVLQILFDQPARAKFLRITQTGHVDGLYWSIHELNLLASRKGN
jgi:mono/diheme cytochrome c family protein